MYLLILAWIAGEDDFNLKIQAIIDACNDVYLKGETKTQQRLGSLAEFWRESF